MKKTMWKQILIIIFFIKITHEDDIIGFYQEFDTSTLTYTWKNCDPNCYTCNKFSDSINNNNNCLSCNSKKGLYFLDGDTVQNCYKEDNIPNNIYNNCEYFLDTRQTPNKWVACHPNCKTCSDKVSFEKDQSTKIQMNCIECKSNYIKVNTFCFPKNTANTYASDNIGFVIDGQTKYCGEFTDDETGQTLGIYENGDKCIIKPESSYFPKNDSTRLLKNCERNCISCIGVPNNDTEIICSKCKENYIFYQNSDPKECKCPNHLGTEVNTNNCVNCKYSPEGPYNYKGVCKDSKVIGGITYNITNTTYNIISKCKRPCLECEGDYNSRCITCAPNYYLNKIALQNSSITDNNEICLTYKECSLIGFPDVDFLECNFCDKDNNKYKLINESGCKEINDTDIGYYFLKDDHYPALGFCHERCETCYGNPKGEYYHNCKTCKDPFVIDEETTNCEIVVEEEEEQEEEEEEIVCQNLFYFDEDEEEIGLYNQKKCINGSDLCPSEYQYIVPNLMMCVKDESYQLNYNNKGFLKSIEYSTSNDDDKFNRIINDNNLIHFSKNLSYLQHYWEYLDEKIQNREILFDYNLRRLAVHIYRLGSDIVINDEDSTFHLTKSNKQNELIDPRTRYKKNNNFFFYRNANFIDKSYPDSPINWNEYDTYRYTRRISIIYLSECERIIKFMNDISNSALLILKLDIFKNITNNEIVTNKVIYKVYNPDDYSPIDLSICKNYPINIITPTTVSKVESSESYKLFKILLNVKKEGFEPFIVYSDFYTKICNQYNSEHDTDMNMKDRKTYIYDKIKKMNFCQKDCYYRSSDKNINFINCICLPKNVDNDYDISEEAFSTLEDNNEENYKNVDQNKLLEDINKNKVNDYFNFYLMKCFKLLFSYDGFFYNYVSMIIIGMYILYLILIFLYSCIGFDFYINILKEMLFHKFLYREYWLIKKKNEEMSLEENNISFEEEIKEKNINIITNKKIQNRTKTRNVFERVKKFKPTEDNKWIRINKSSVLIDPLKDDQIQPVNEYGYKENDIYKNKDNKIRDYQNDINLNKNAPPKRTDNNNYYNKEKNDDLINARTVKPITSHNYDDIQALVKGKQKNKNIEESSDITNNIIEGQDKEKEEKEKEKVKETENNNINNIIEEIDLDKEKEKEEQKVKELTTSKYNKKTEMHNTSPAIYIYNLILSDYPTGLTLENKEEKEISNLITKREYSFLNDGEINELDYDNSVFHDKRNFIRIYYSFLKYNCIIIFTFFVYEDFNLNLVKYALLVFYALLYLTFNTTFFNNNTIHNIYINEGDYVITYHLWKIFLAFILSLIFIKLIKWWITFYRRKSLSMKLLKRYTDAKNEILRMIELYHFHLKIFFPISCALFILFWYYISTVCAVFRYSFWHLLLNWAFCAAFHLGYSIVLNIIPTIFRFVAIRKEIKCLYTTSKYISYFL